MSLTSRVKKRSIDDIYLDLNGSLRNKERTNTPLPKTARPVYSVVNHPSKFETNTSNFRTVISSAREVESALSTSRKSKESIVNKFIKEFNPSPIQILQKISQVSEQHRSLLNRIINELKKYPVEELKDPIFELQNDSMAELSAIKLKLRDTNNEVLRLKQEEKLIRLKIEEAKKKLDEAKSEHLMFNKMIECSTFEVYESQKINEEIDRQMKLGEKKTEDSSALMRYNTLWGEQVYLKSEIQVYEQKLAEQRKINLERSTQIAKEMIEEEKRQNEVRKTNT